MKNKPKRVYLTEAREEQVKGKLHYNKLYVYDPNFLDEYKQVIINAFANDPATQKRVTDNMDAITEFIIGDRVDNGLSRLCCAQNQIHMDIQFADITEDSFTIKPGCEYIETILVHELLHAAARKNRLTGVTDYLRDENGKAIGRKNVGLNEGITQFLAEQMTGTKVADEINSYTFNTHIVSLLEDTLGPGMMHKAYFGDSNILKDEMNALAQDPEFYDKFNRDLDTINKLQTTLRRIKLGTIKPKDDTSKEKMEVVLKAQQERLIENVFANIIIPQIQKYKSDDLDVLVTQTLRQKKLLEILSNNENLLKVVAKYISPSLHSEFASDEALKAIQKEIRENGIDFGKVAEAARKIESTKRISKAAANEFTSVVNEFHEDRKEDLTTDRSTQLSKFLKDELVSMLKRYDEVKELSMKMGGEELERFKRYDEWFRAHFSKIPNLDEEIAKIRAEQNSKNQPASTHQAEAEAIVEAAKRAGSQYGQEDSGKKKEDTPQQEPEQPKKKVEMPPEQKDTSVLSKPFVASDITGQVFDQRNKSLYDKVVDYANATGKGINPDDTLLVEMREKATSKYVSNLPANPPKALYAVYGDKWREVLAQAFAEGYRQGMSSRLNEATQEGLEARRVTEEKIERGAPIEEPARVVDFEELKFIHDTFKIVPQEDGITGIVNAENNKVVMSDRTATAVMYAEEWIAAVGIEQEDHTIEAFTPKHAEMFETFNTTVRNHINADGQLDVDAAMEELASKGEAYKTLGEGLLDDPERTKLVSEYLTLNYEKKIEPEPVIIAPEPTQSHLPDTPLTELADVVKFASEAKLDEITPHLNVFGAPPVTIDDGMTVHAFNEPLMAAKLNERYREFTGEDHPMFVANAPDLIDGLIKNKDVLLAANAYKPEYFEQLVTVRKGLEERHQELVSVTAEEKSGHR